MRGTQCILGLVVPEPNERAWCCVERWELKSNCPRDLKTGVKWIVYQTHQLQIDTFPWLCACRIGDLGAGVANSGEKR